MSNYEEHIELITETVRANGVRKGFARLRDQIGGSEKSFIYFCRDNGIRSRPRSYYGLPTPKKQKKGDMNGLARDNDKARKAGTSYGKFKGQEYCKSHPLVRKN